MDSEINEHYYSKKLGSKFSRSEISEIIEICRIVTKNDLKPIKEQIVETRDLLHYFLIYFESFKDNMFDWTSYIEIVLNKIIGLFSINVINIMSNNNI